LSREKVEKGEREGEGEARRGEGERGREEAQGNKRPRGRALQVKAASAGPGYHALEENHTGTGTTPQATLPVVGAPLAKPRQHQP
jgi:hypothetical protein